MLHALSDILSLEIETEDDHVYIPDTNELLLLAATKPMEINGNQCEPIPTLLLNKHMC